MTRQYRPTVFRIVPPPDGVLQVPVAALSKDQAKALHQVVGAYGAACTVKQARDFCSPGPKMTAFYTVLVVAFFVGLSVLWLPFLFMAATSVVVVPLRAVNGAARWAQILPPERDGDLLELA